jgi:hypothetical protein
MTVGLFVAWCAFGLAALVALQADVGDLRVALTAPMLGTALLAIPLFVLSNAGVPMETGATPVCAVLLVGSIVVLARRRPRLPLAVAPVLLLCGVSLALLGRPMFEFGLDWIANATWRTTSSRPRNSCATDFKAAWISALSPTTGTSPPRRKI